MAINQDPMKISVAYPTSPSWNDEVSSLPDLVTCDTPSVSSPLSKNDGREIILHKSSCNFQAAIDFLGSLHNLSSALDKTQTWLAPELQKKTAHSTSVRPPAAFCSLLAKGSPASSPASRVRQYISTSRPTSTLLLVLGQLLPPGCSYVPCPVACTPFSLLQLVTNYIITLQVRLPPKLSDS